MAEAKLDIYTFGKQLLDVGDLDPVYIVLWEAQLEKPMLLKWLLSYTCFYHVGTASWIVSQPDYWGAMLTAAGSKDYLRSSERRHYRGAQAVKSVTWLKEQGMSRLFAPIVAKPIWKSEDLINEVRKWVGFGPWVSFKVADLFERLNICQVEFSFDSAMYDSPTKAAVALWQEEVGAPEISDRQKCQYAVERILGELKGNTAPPRHERQLNVQEAETILCKHKSYLSGHYHIGEDVAAVRKGLLSRSKCKVSQRLLAGGKKGKLWQ